MVFFQSKLLLAINIQNLMTVKKQQLYFFAYFKGLKALKWHRPKATRNKTRTFAPTLWLCKTICVVKSLLRSKLYGDLINLV